MLTCLRLAHMYMLICGWMEFGVWREAGAGGRGLTSACIAIGALAVRRPPAPLIYHHNQAGNTIAARAEADRYPTTVANG